MKPIRPTRVHNRIAVLFAGAAALLAAPAAHAQSVFDDFSSGNDSLWFRVDAPALFTGVPSTYSVPNEQYRLQGPAVPPGNPALATGAVRPDGAAINSQVSVDVMDWSDSSNQAMAVGARFSQVSPTSFQFYTASFYPVSVLGPGMSAFRIERYNSDLTTTEIATTGAFSAVDPSHIFRLVLSLDGPNLRADLFDLTVDATNPLKTLSAIDNGPGSLLGGGLPGVLTYGNGVPGPADATFDNFRVIPGPGAASLIGLVALFGCQLRRRR